MPDLHTCANLSPILIITVSAGALRDLIDASVRHAASQALGEALQRLLGSGHVRGEDHQRGVEPAVGVLELLRKVEQVPSVG